MLVLTWLLVALAVVLLFGAAIFVHEFGHYWVARRCGLKVEAFSIGFGPKIFGWTRHGIEYAWRWIPAGGYVKLPQMVTSEAIEGKDAASQDLPPADPVAKILVALAGPAMNLIFGFVIATVIYFVGLPVRINPAVIGEVPANSPEAALGIRAGDRVVAVNGKVVTSWEDVQMTAALAQTNVLPVTIEHEGEQHTYPLTAQVNEQLGLKLFNLDPLEHPVVREVIADSAAQEAGLKNDDVVISFAGVPVVGQEQLIQLIGKRPGLTSPMEIQRGNQRLHISVTPRYDPVKKAGRLGIAIGTSAVTVYQLQKPGPLPWELVGQILQQTFDMFGALAHSKQTGVGVKDLSGPPGILMALAAELKANFRLGLRFMVLLNLNLAILNLLPLPVLDGGHIVMSCLEKLRGRPVSRRFQEYATSVFAVLLISFMLYASFNDLVKRGSLFKFMMNQKTQIETGTNGAGQ